MSTGTSAAAAAHTRAVWEYDCSSGAMLWSPEFGTLFGLDESVAPTSYAWLQTIAPEDRARVDEQLFHPPPGHDTLTIECRHLRGAEVHHRRLTGRVFRDPSGAPLRVVGSGSSVTAPPSPDVAGPLAGTMELLANRIAEFEALMDLLPLAAVVAEDPECRFIRGNAVFQRLFRVPPDANVSVTAPADQRPAWRVFREGRELSAIELPVQRSAALGVRVSDEPITIRFDDGRELHLVTSVTPLFDAAGEPRGAIGVFTDVTERREHERWRDAFASMLAHELRQPLAALVTAHEVLGIRPSSGAALDVARRQTAHMSRLVNDLMDLARLSRGALTIVREDVDVVPLLRQTIELVAPAVARKHQRLELTGIDRAVVTGDPTRLQQVFTNLVHNASKFGPEGDTLLVTVSADAASVSVTVTDHGRGITAEQLPRIFDLFTGVSDASLGGLGIGLHIVRAIVQLHGGTITARSDGEGTGATFTVTLPVAV